MWMISKNDDLRSMHVHLPFNTHAYNILRHTHWHHLAQACIHSLAPTHTCMCPHRWTYVSPQLHARLHTYLYRCMCYRRMHVERHTHASLQAHLRLLGHLWRCVFYYVGTCIHPPPYTNRHAKHETAGKHMLSHWYAPHWHMHAGWHLHTHLLANTCPAINTCLQLRACTPADALPAWPHL